MDQCPDGTMSVPSETGGMKCMDCEGICDKGKSYFHLLYVLKTVQIVSCRMPRRCQFRH